MSSNYKRLLKVNVIAISIFVYVNIFVNLYLWEENGKIGELALFNGILFIASSMASSIGGKLLKTKNVQYVMRMFVVFSVLTFLFLSFVKLGNYTLWIAILGILIGLATGFFWVANNYAINSFGKNKEIIDFLLKNSVASQIIGITIPVLSAVVIKSFGFAGSFILMLGLTVVMFFAVSLIPKIGIEQKEEEVNEKVMKKPKTKWLILSTFIGGAFLQFQALFVLIYTFTITEDKMLIALLNVGYTIISILAFVVYKKVKILNEYQWLLIGIISIIVGFICALKGEATYLIISNALTVIGVFFVGTIFSAQAFRVFENENSSVKVKMIVLREWCLTLGRSVMLFLIIFVTEPKGTYFMSLMVIAILLSLVLPLVQKRMLRGIKKEKTNKPIG